MFFDPSSATAAVAAARQDLGRAVEALAVAGPDPWQGAAATAFAAARDAALVSARAAEARLAHAREGVRAFEEERATWIAMPRGWLP